MALAALAPAEMPRTTSVLTVGYAGHTLRGFVQLLADEGVETLIDVRELPLSRKKGFSKTPLRAGLEPEGIGYVHLRELGAPRALRHRLRTTGDFGPFRTGYRQHLGDRTKAVDELVAHAATKRTVIMCVEPNASECHRGILAETLKRRGVRIVHLD